MFINLMDPRNFFLSAQWVLGTQPGIKHACIVLMDVTVKIESIEPTNEIGEKEFGGLGGAAVFSAPGGRGE